MASTPAKRADELAMNALETFRTEIRPAIQRDFNMAFKLCVDQIRKAVKDEIMNELKPMLKSELREVSSSFGQDLSDGTSTCVRTVIKEELGTVLEKIDQLASQHVSSKKAPVATEAAPAISPLKAFRATTKGTKRKATLRDINVRVSDEFKDHIVDDSSLAVASIPTSRSGDERRSLMDERVDSPRALALIAETDDAETTSRPLDWADAVENIILSDSFEWSMTAVILANAILLGVSTDYAAQNLHTAQPPIFDILDSVFFVVFVIELSLRLFVYRMAFFTMEGCMANMFDFFLVVLQLFDELSKVPWIESVPGGLQPFNMLRGLRLLRVVRLLRIVRLIRFVSVMRMMVSSLICSMKSLCGALCLLGMVLYLVGVLFTQIVVDKRRELPDLESEEIQKHFGSVLKTMLSLYMSITGGINWATATDLLSLYGSPAAVTFFCVYIAFCVFAILNVVTAVFVGQATQSVQEDQDNFMANNINALFKKTDMSADEITWEEFSQLMKEPEMIELFKAINIAPSEATSLFQLLDVHDTRVLDYSEFMSGCLRLRGPAKSLELALLMRETTRIHQWNSKKLMSIEERLTTLMTILDEPGDEGGA